MKSVVWYLTFTLIVQLMWPLCDTSPQGDSIRKRLTEDIANSIIGVKEFQDYIHDGVTFVNTPLKADDMAKKVAGALRDRLWPKINSLQTLKSSIEALYRSSSVSSRNPYQKCCSIALPEKSTRLIRKEVNLNELCIVGEEGLKHAKEFPSKSITDVVKGEYEKDFSSLYIYFGNQEGVLFNYPAVETCSQTYDPRFRPWYVKTAAPYPKDLVVVIDKSGSMDIHVSIAGKTLMALAKVASITVMETLNPNDRIGIVDFSTEAHVPPGNQEKSSCYSNKLAKATPENKQYLEEYINNIHPNGSTYYSKALKKAFQYFINTEAESSYEGTRDKMILFLTDGEPSEANQSLIHDTIAEENAKLKNKVVILTYGIGLSSKTVILKHMASQKYHHRAYGKPKKGIYKSVMDVSTLKSAMGSYYELFNEIHSSRITFTHPYVGAFDSFPGLMMSICLPVLNQGKFKGVVCIDLSMNYILQDLVYFDGYQSSYGFIVDDHSSLISHPMLQPPAEVTNNIEFVYLKTLESSLKDVVIDRMASGKTGSVTVSSRRILARGNVTLEGTKNSITKSTYIWHPVEFTNFTVCMVMAIGDHISTIDWKTAFPSFLYHKLNLSPTPLETCNYFTQTALKGKGASISFAPGCFKDPYQFIYSDDTRATVQSFHSYLEGHASLSNPEFKSGIRETVAVMAKFDSIVKTRMKFEIFIVWHYLASRNGIFKIHPASEQPMRYDARTRPWFLRAKAFPHLLVISTPYTDYFCKRTVISINKAIIKYTSGGQTDFLGVIGVDVTLSYFYNTIIQAEEICQTHTCFMINKAGYIVAHKDWIASPTHKPRIESVHISLYEPYIASKLFLDKVIAYGSCINTQLKRFQYFTMVTQDKNIITDNFELHVIKDTNIYMIVKKKSEQASCSSCFDTYSLCRDDFKSGCFCPCHQPVDEVYEYCSGEFKKFSDSVQPCTPVITPLTLLEYGDDNTESTAVETLPECTSYECNATSKSKPSLCNIVITCSWCQFDSEGMPMEQPYCTTEDICPFGSLANIDPESTITPSAERGTPAPTWLIAVFVIVPLLLIVGAALGNYFRRKRGRHMSRRGTLPPHQNPTGDSTVKSQSRQETLPPHQNPTGDSTVESKSRRGTLPSHQNPPGDSTVESKSRRGTLPPRQNPPGDSTVESQSRRGTLPPRQNPTGDSTVESQ